MALVHDRAVHDLHERRQLAHAQKRRAAARADGACRARRGPVAPGSSNTWSKCAILAVLGCAIGLAFARMGRVGHSLGCCPACDSRQPRVPCRRAHSGLCGGRVDSRCVLFGLAPAWRATDVDIRGLTPVESGGDVAEARATHGPSAGGGVRSGSPCCCWSARDCSCRRCGFVASSTSVSTPTGCCRLSIDTRFAGYKEGQVPALSRLLLERVSAIPGVRSTASVGNPLMQGSSTSMGLPLPGLARGSRDVGRDLRSGRNSSRRWASSWCAGRTFTAADFERLSPSE